MRAEGVGVKKLFTKRVTEVLIRRRPLASDKFRLKLTRSDRAVGL